MNNTMHPLGTQVFIDNLKIERSIKREGRIVGVTILYDSILMPRPVYMVELIEGFYSPQEDMFVSVIMCDPSTVFPST